MKTKLEKDTIMYTYLEAFEKGYSSGDFSDVFPCLAEDCVMESQWVLTPNRHLCQSYLYYHKKSKHTNLLSHTNNS